MSVPAEVEEFLARPLTAHLATAGPHGLSIVPCTINGVDAFVIRTDKNDRGEGDHQPNVIEVAAARNLRDTLGLADGDEVTVEVPY